MAFLRKVFKFLDGVYSSKNWSLSNKNNWLIGYAYCTSKVDIPSPPKRPLSAYMLFCQEHRQSVIKENPKLSSSELVKKLAEKWSNLSKDMRKPYEISARENTLIYGEAHKNFYENLTSEQKEELARLKAEQKEARRLAKLKRALRESNLPKSPGSAYNLFVRSQAKKLDVKERYEFIRECAELWKKMSEEEKKQFRKEAELEKLRYADEMKNWRERLLKEGKSDLVNLFNDLKGRGKLDDEYSISAKGKKSVRKSDGKEQVV